jgi:hypothetical protein
MQPLSSARKSVVLPMMVLIGIKEDEFDICKEFGEDLKVYLRSINKR